MVTPVHDQSLIRRAPGTVETTLDDEVVLMKLESGECIGMGATGSAIWRLAEQPIRIADLIAQLQQTYEAPEGVIAQDVTEFVREMHNHGLVTIA